MWNSHNTLTESTSIYVHTFAPNRQCHTIILVPFSLTTNNTIQTREK